MRLRHALPALALGIALVASGCTATPAAEQPTNTNANPPAPEETLSADEKAFVDEVLKYAPDEKDSVVRDGESICSYIERGESDEVVRKAATDRINGLSAEDAQAVVDAAEKYICK